MPLLSGRQPELSSVVWSALIGAFLWSGASAAVRGGRSQKAVQQITLAVDRAPRGGRRAHRLARARGRRRRGGRGRRGRHPARPTAAPPPTSTAPRRRRSRPRPPARTPVTAVAIPLPVGASVDGALSGQALVGADRRGDAELAGRRRAGRRQGRRADPRDGRRGGHPLLDSGTVTPEQTSTGAAQRRGPFRAGDRVQLTDPRGRLHTITLAEGGSFHTHRGYLTHDSLLGAPEGTVVRNTSGIEYLAVRPLLADYVLSMPRGAAVVYPKDSGQIVAMADIYPGARVIEAGVGSGALTMSLLRAVGDGGSLHSIERREDFAAIARGNVEGFFGGPHPAWELSVGDLSDVLPTVAEPGSVDRVVLDMLAPVGEPRRGRRRARPRRRLHLLRRDDDAAVAPGRGHPHRRPVHRAGGVGVDGARLAPRGSGGAPAAPDDRPHRVPAHHASARGRRRRPAAPSSPGQGRLPGRAPTVRPRSTTPSSGRPRPWASGPSPTRSCAGRAATSARRPPA